MNRRSFFQKAATGAAVLAIAPQVLSELFIPKAAYRTYVMGKDAIFTAPPEGWTKYKFKMTTTLPPECKQRIRVDGVWVKPKLNTEAS